MYDIRAYGATAEADDILCFAGAEEGLYLAMQVLVGPGDHAIVVTPNYQAAETVPLALCDVLSLIHISEPTRPY